MSPKGKSMEALSLSLPDEAATTEFAGQTPRPLPLVLARARRSRGTVRRRPFPEEEQEGHAPWLLKKREELDDDDNEFV